MGTGQALSEPGPSSTDPDLDLHGRLKAVDVGAVQESDLDESHGGEDSVPGVSHEGARAGRPARLAVMDPLVSQVDLDRLTALMTAQLPAYLADLQRLVDIDCGSYTKVGVDEVGRWVASAFGDLGASVEITANTDHGDTVVGTLGKRDAAGRALLMVGHLDTVFDPGTVAERPFAIRDGVATGPGVSDMKGGLLAGLYALRVLRAFGPLPFGRIVFVANPDEEIGSPVSTPVIQAHAATVDVALVLEGARANGDIVSSRKGIADFELRITGRAAHAGVEPEKGRSAVLEAAHKIIALHALNGRWPGVTVNAGVVRGGTRPNVVAAETVIQVDLRSVQRATLEEAEAAIRSIADAATVPDTACEVVVMGRFWPMEKLERSGRLVDRAVGIAAGLGFPLHDAATGGASDANTTSGMGVPTIDGLGPIGGSDRLARGIPGGRLHRASNGVAGGAHPGPRPRPGRGWVGRGASRPDVIRSRGNGLVSRGLACVGSPARAHLPGRVGATPLVRVHSAHQHAGRVPDTADPRPDAWSGLGWVGAAPIPEHPRRPERSSPA